MTAWLISIGACVLVSALIAFGARIERNRLRAAEALRLGKVIGIHDKIKTKLDATHARIDSGALSQSDIGAMLSTYSDTDAPR